MKTRFTHAAWTLFAAALLAAAVAGCAGMGSDPAPMDKKGGMAPAPYTQERPYTKDYFGPWGANMAGVHLPQITCEKAGKGLKVTVKIDDHPMDPNLPHYIMWIKIEDGQGNPLGETDFMATDPAPVTTFMLATAPAKIKAFERCNVHGIWMSERDVK